MGDNAAAWRFALRKIWPRVVVLNRLRKQLMADSQPKWALTPEGVASVESLREDQHGVTIVLDNQSLQSSRGLVERLFRDLPVPRPDELDEGRPHGCWLALSAPGGPIEVRIGRYRLATLPTEHAPLAEELIAAHGGSRGAVEVIADLHGTGPDAAYVELCLPDRP